MPGDIEVVVQQVESLLFRWQEAQGGHSVDWES